MKLAQQDDDLDECEDPELRMQVALHMAVLNGAPSIAGLHMLREVVTEGLPAGKYMRRASCAVPSWAFNAPLSALAVRW